MTSMKSPNYLNDEKKLKSIDNARCPECAEKIVEWDPVDCSVDALQQSAECLGCGTSFTVFYKAASYRIN